MSLSVQVQDREKVRTHTWLHGVCTGQELKHMEVFVLVISHLEPNTLHVSLLCSCMLVVSQVEDWAGCEASIHVKWCTAWLLFIGGVGGGEHTLPGHWYRLYPPPGRYMSSV